jgi:purine-binding chemotaxis protein CheW
LAAPVPVLVLRCGAFLAALPVAQVVEVFRPLPVEPMGEAPDFVRGVALVRGNPTAVLDLRRLLGEGTAQPASRWVSLRLEERRVALAVDEVFAVRDMDLSLCGPLPALMEEGTPAVEALGRLDQRLLLLLRATYLIPGDAWLPAAESL